MAYPNANLNSYTMNTIELTFTITPYAEAVADAMIAELGNIGYDGFSYTDTGFSAYIPVADYRAEAVDALDMPAYFSEWYRIDRVAREIEDRDWNREWEEHFTPIVVDNRIQVRAGFHERVPGIEYDIVIEPKMSFGTGHHATTALMLRMILEHAADIRGKRVLDMGCGTGILGIMASKVGAREVVGIDIDDWAYRNAMENLRNNGISGMTVRIGDAALLADESPFGVIFANINRNILLADMEHYVDRLLPQGVLVMSGFYEQDLPMIREKAESLGLVFGEYREENSWTAACFTALKQEKV